LDLVAVLKAQHKAPVDWQQPTDDRLVTELRITQDDDPAVIPPLRIDLLQ
jgi:hypothetical protein